MSSMLGSIPQARPSPFRPLPQHDASLLRRLFRAARFPDSECWRHLARVKVKAEDGAMRELTIVVGVQLGAAPLQPETATAFISVRDEETPARWTGSSHGRLSSSPAVRYASPGWLVVRLDPQHVTFEHDAIGVGLSPEDVRSGVYVVQVRAESVELQLQFAHSTSVTWSRDGWVDHNPRGAVPLWAAGRLRFGTVLGSLRLRLASDAMSSFSIVDSIAHFEQRCIVASASTVPLAGALLRPDRALATLRELASLRRCWRRFWIELEPGVSFFAEQLWDAAATDAVFQRAVVADATQRTATVADLSFELSDDPSTRTSGSIAWRVVESADPLALGTYRSTFKLREQREKTSSELATCDVELEHVDSGSLRHRVGYLEVAEFSLLPTVDGT